MIAESRAPTPGHVRCWRWSLTVVPLPAWLDSCGPPFLVLTVLYWSIAAPRAAGSALGFFAGLALDVFQGAVLGQHALALSLITYIAVREHQKIRSKPAFQQALIVLARWSCTSSSCSPSMAGPVIR